MRWRNTTQKYGIITRLLHWLVGLTIISQIILAIVMENATGSIVGTLYFVHKSLGLTLLFLAVMFVVWRFFNPPPKLPASTPPWQKLAANVMHITLYALILIMPLSGWFMSTAAGYTPNFWGWFSLPAPIGVCKAAAAFFSLVHEICAWLIGICIIIHVLAALKHALIDKNDVLKRML